MFHNTSADSSANHKTNKLCAVVHIEQKSPFNSETALPVLPYRLSTVPKNLSARLKKSESLSSSSWKSVLYISRKMTSFKFNTEKSPDYRSEGVWATAGDVEVPVPIKPNPIPPVNGPASSKGKIDESRCESRLPPPLPPRRTSSRRCLGVMTTVTNLGTSPITGSDHQRTSVKEALDSNTVLGTPGDESQSSCDEADLSLALQRISRRLNQLQVESSPVLSHYSQLYRLDEGSNRQTPAKSNFQLRPHHLTTRAKRCNYMNLN